MPRKPKRPCSAPSCPNLTQEQFCSDHADRVKQTDKERGTAAQRGYGSAWRKARAGFLRKNPLCVQCMEQGLIVEATVVDHIKPHKGDKVLFWDRLNWQPLCKSHHDAKTAREDGGFGNSSYVSKGVLEEIKRPSDIGKSAIPITIVCGPSGSGKTTYVQHHKQHGDVVIDLDEIIARISGNPWYVDRERWVRPALIERNRILRDLSTRHTGYAWFIVSAPTRRERDWWATKLGATVVVLEVPLEQCAERLRADNRRVGKAERFIQLASDWWHEYN